MLTNSAFISRAISALSKLSCAMTWHPLANALAHDRQPAAGARLVPDIFQPPGRAGVGPFGNDLGGVRRVGAWCGCFDNDVEWGARRPVGVDVGLDLADVGRSELV